MFRRTFRWFAALSMLATVAAVPACQFDQDGNLVNERGVVVARLAAQTRPRVLYLTHTAGFKHDVLPHSETVLQKLGDDQGWDVMVTKDVSLLTASTLKDYAAVVFYTTGELPISDQQKQDLLAYIRGGGGIVGVHSATDTFYKWPEYGEIMGGYFDNHPWHEEVGVIVEDRTHASTKHLPERFRITDEIYQHRNWSRDNVHVLVKLDPDTVDLTKKGVNRTDRDFGLSWTNTYGEGRSFYTAFGHRQEVWDDPRFQTHLVEGIRWAMKKQPGLSSGEKQDGWTPLFNGTSLEGWRAFKSETPPTGWEVSDGVLARTGAGGDLMTTRQFADFILDLDYRIAVGGNSGIMYRVTTDGDRPYYSGPEYQILDNERHADAKNGRDRYAGANYALHPPATDSGNPAGQWNNARIVVTGNLVEHWLNGEKVVSYELHSDDWKKRVAASKFAEWPMYGKAARGHIVLQDHGDLVEFRNITIKEIR